MENYGKTIINKNSSKYAIIELSTKAIKLLIGPDNPNFENGIIFKNFYRQSELSYIGICTDDNFYVDIECFEKKTLPIIKKVVENAKRLNVGTIYTVATAAYRNAKNKDYVLSAIFNETGLNVRILKKPDEALSTLLAFYFSKPKDIQLNKYVLLLDQGGGSTEISLFRDKDLIYTNSFDLGTTILQKAFFKNKSLPIEKAHNNCLAIIQEEVYSNIDLSQITFNQEVSCIGIGTAITKATGKQNNQQQHGYILNINMLIDKIKIFENKLIDKYPDLVSMEKDIMNLRNKNNPYRKILTSYLGLPMIIEIMQLINIEDIIINGAGLWYGIYFSKLYNIEL